MPEANLVRDSLDCFHITRARSARNEAPANELSKAQDCFREGIRGKAQHCVAVDERVLEVDA